MTMNALISCVYTTLGTFDSLTTFVGKEIICLSLTLTHPKKNQAFQSTSSSYWPCTAYGEFENLTT